MEEKLTCINEPVNLTTTAYTLKDGGYLKLGEMNTMNSITYTTGTGLKFIPGTKPYTTSSFVFSAEPEPIVKESVPMETKTVIAIGDSDMKIYLKKYSNGKLYEKQRLLPDIDDIEVIDNRVVIVKFCDKTSEKAVLKNGDEFSLEYGLSICLTKKLLSDMTNGNGSSVYNKLVEYFVKAYKNIQEAKRIEAETTEEFERIKNRRIAKAKAKREKRERKIREDKIEMQKEAYIRAMRELNNATPD